jgi:hypothetical protein
MDFYIDHTIHAASEEVARVMFDPDREAEWMAKTGPAERLTPGPLAVGSRVKHTAGVHGWPVSFVTEVKAIDPGRRLEMEVVGPSRSRSGVIIYQVAPTAGGAIATIHVRDDEVGPHPVSAWARKQQAQENLARLATLLSRTHA